VYIRNPAFVAKMILIVLAGLNFLLYYFFVEPVLLRSGPNAATPMLAKAVGVMSLSFWVGVLVLGRLLPYLGTTGG
jgi:formate-dependent nitrite reductase membrane component NrfD